jgi:hypothetical protein
VRQQKARCLLSGRTAPVELVSGGVGVTIAMFAFAGYAAAAEFYVISRLAVQDFSVN